MPARPCGVSRFGAGPSARLAANTPETRNYLRFDQNPRIGVCGRVSAVSGPQPGALETCSNRAAHTHAGRTTNSGRPRCSDDHDGRPAARWRPFPCSLSANVGSLRCIDGSGFATGPRSCPGRSERTQSGTGSTARSVAALVGRVRRAEAFDANSSSHETGFAGSNSVACTSPCSPNGFRHHCRHSKYYKHQH